MAKFQLRDLTVQRLEHYKLSEVLNRLPTVKVWFPDQDWRKFTWGDNAHSLVYASDIITDLDDGDVPDDVDAGEWSTFIEVLDDMGFSGLIDLDI